MDLYELEVEDVGEELALELVLKLVARKKKKERWWGRGSVGQRRWTW